MAQKSSVDVDVVVIGSGAGGLTAAVACANAGLKVLVLEQHYLPGGWCHSFPLGGYKFSPGVHYIGELGPGERLRHCFEGLGFGADLTFCELNPSGFEHVLIAGNRFDWPKGRFHVAKALADRFPHERAGIHAFFDMTKRVADELSQLMDLRSFSDVLHLPKIAPNALRFTAYNADRYIRHFVKDPHVVAILSTQCGDYGLPPSKAPALLHIGLMDHYFNGGYYPRGGGAAIPRAMIRRLRKKGGELRVRTRVQKILVERGQVLGVRLTDGTEIRAKHVISNADPVLTFSKLIGDEHLSWLRRFQLRRTKYSGACVSLFMGSTLDVQEHNVDSGNYWYYRTTDIDAGYKQALRLDAEKDDAEGLFLTCTTLKDPSKSYGGPRKGHHTFEAFLFMDYKPFERWENSSQDSRPESYLTYKKQLESMILRTADKIIPNFSESVVFSEIGTPLTNQFYCEATRGNMYGTEKSIFHMGPFGYQIGTEFKGLTLTGASTIGHGVMGAVMSGIAAAKHVLKCPTKELLSFHSGEITLVPGDSVDDWPAHLLKKHTNEEPEEQAETA